MSITKLNLWKEDSTYSCEHNSWQKSGINNDILKYNSLKKCSVWEYNKSQNRRKPNLII